MDYKYLLAAAVLCILLLIASNVTIYIVHRKLKFECTNKEKNMLELHNRIEALNKEVANLSSLYDDSLEDCKKRTEFYSNITHELKTPLSVILGAIQLMERKLGGQTEEAEMINRNFRIIRHNCYRLLRLANNLLDLTKMEAGYLLFKPVNCDLNLLLEEIVQSVIPYAAQKQLELHYSKSAVPIKTAVDIEKMERIILNLLSNSIKFTKPGGTINVSSYMADNSICIAVKDSGVGIPVEMQEEVFGRYKQAGKYPSLENEGSGIGLSLVKSFVSLHRGNIKVISENGSGCEFIIDLPPMHENDSTDESGLDDYYFRISEAANIEFADMHPIAS
jgi:two-component system, cell cycle sensor histidine kinase PleC